MADKQSLPTTASFNPETIDKWVMNKIFKRNPVTLFAPVTGVLFAGGSYAVLQTMSPLMMVAVGGGITVGLGSLLVDLFVRKDSIRMSYLAEANKQLEAQAEQLTRWLESEFQELGHTQSLDLLNRLKSYMDAFEDVLEDKFQVGTETHEHFHGAAEALLNQTLNTLKDVASQVKVNMAIDLDTASETAVLGYQRGEERLVKLLASADSAVVGLAELNQKVAAISSGDQNDLSEFLKEVQTLANQSKNYIDERTL